jgi:hypothetical protein
VIDDNDIIIALHGLLDHRSRDELDGLLDIAEEEWKADEHQSGAT